MQQQPSIRKATIEDVAIMRELIVDLARYEKAEDQVRITLEQLRSDGFGPDPGFQCFLAELDRKVCGLAIYYPVYSTWRGRSMYLEDLIVKDSARGKGVGMALMRSLCDEALSAGCRQMMWQVIDWNEPAIRFYESFGTELDRQWIDCDLNYEAMKALSNG